MRLTRDGALLDPALASELRAARDAGERARDEMVRANLGLVVYVARRQRATALPLLDLIQEGNIGLLRAVDKFDPSRGFRFSTHAVWWIRQAIQTGIARGERTVRLPEGVRHRIAQIRRAENELTIELARQPTSGEVSRLTGMDVGEVVHILVAGSPMRSLEEPLNVAGEDRAVVGDVVADTSFASPVDHVVMASTAQEITILLSRLDERERSIISMRFGLDRRAPRTLQEVAQRFGITAERVRQIEARAIEKLRRAAGGADP
jgi:RNA polymerase sigma factor (sigma-70 family)